MKTIKCYLVAALAAFLALPAFAQSIDETPEDWVSPPRLAVAEGDVQLWRTSGDGWESAPVNTALAQGDSLSAGPNATIELQIGPRDFARLPANSQITLVAHNPGLIHFHLSSGTASFDLRGSRNGQLVRVDADNVNLVLGGRGYYRISTRDGETRVTVRNQGRASLTFVDGSSRSIASGEELLVRGRREAVVDVHGAPAPDAWDRWNDARSDYYAASVSNRYVPAEVYGAADLDTYGRWREDRTYGWVWAPGVASGWAPYSTGSWRWDPVYGWTWVDTAPWGWTTSHYGRWVSVGGGWVWAPGPRAVHVRYVPALVAFFQVQSGVGWVALGWGEPLIPWWGRPGFRGNVWWGGWGGPHRDFDRDRPVYLNHDARNAFIGMRDEDFGRRPVHGGDLPPPRMGDARPIGSDHPFWRGPARGPVGPAIGQPGPRNEGPRMSPQQDRRPSAPQFQPGPLNRPEAKPEMRPETRSPVAAPARPVESAPSLDRRNQEDRRERQRFEPREQPRMEQPRIEQPHRVESREQPRMEAPRQAPPEEGQHHGEERRQPVHKPGDDRRM